MPKRWEAALGKEVESAGDFAFSISPISLAQVF